MDSHACRAWRLALRWSAVPFEVRPVVLGSGVPVGYVHRRHIPNGPGDGAGFSLFYSTLFCIYRTPGMARDVRRASIEIDTIALRRKEAN